MGDRATCKCSRKNTTWIFVMFTKKHGYIQLSKGLILDKIQKQSDQIPVLSFKKKSHPPYETSSFSGIRPNKSNGNRCSPRSVQNIQHFIGVPHKGAEWMTRRRICQIRSRFQELLFGAPKSWNHPESSRIVRKVLQLTSLGGVFFSLGKRS